MTRATARMLATLVALTFVACSDDSTSADAHLLPDTGPGVEASVDLSQDLASDVTPDAPADLAADGPGQEAAPPTEGGVDLPPGPDLAVDGPMDAGAVAITGTVSRSVAPVLDGKGTLYVGVYNLLFPPPVFPVGTAIIQGADMSAATAKISYAIANVPPGTYNLWAFLDDNGNAGLPFLTPDAPDLVMSAPLQITVTAGTTTTQDLVLDKLQGGAGDGGLGTNGALKGTISASVAPVLDGKGTLYLSLHNQVPPAGQVGSTSLTNADLSSPYAKETYFLGPLPPGQYYLRVFLDDNLNANFLFLGPDKNDLVHANPIQVHVVSGTVNIHDVVLDKVQP
jgi:uncharacterized protein (DUF2141 family)